MGLCFGFLVCVCAKAGLAENTKQASKNDFKFVSVFLIRRLRRLQVNFSVADDLHDLVVPRQADKSCLFACKHRKNDVVDPLIFEPETLNKVPFLSKPNSLHKSH